MKANLDGVFAVDWEVVRHRNATARPEGQGVVLTVVLHQSWVHAIRGNGGPDRGDPHRETTDLSGGRQVPRNQVWRNRQHLAVVVEPVFVGIVGWQQRGDIDVDREQISHGRLILGPIETMKRLTPPRVRVV